MNLIKNSKKCYINYKSSSFESKAAIVNTFFPTNSTYLVLRKVLVIIYNLYLSSQLLELILTLPKVRKDILELISTLIFGNRKVFLKK